MRIEIFDLKVHNLVDPNDPFGTVYNLEEQVKLFAQYGYRTFRVIRTDSDDRSLYWPVYAYLRYMGVAFDYLAFEDEKIDWWHVINAKRVLGVDIDNTLVIWKDARTFIPNRKIIECVNRKYDEGNVIVIWTGRSYRYWYYTRRFLKDIGVKYDFLVMSKLFADKYIDDMPVVHPEKVDCDSF